MSHLSQEQHDQLYHVVHPLPVSMSFCLVACVSSTGYYIWSNDATSCCRPSLTLSLFIYSFPPGQFTQQWIHPFQERVSCRVVRLTMLDKTIIILMVMVMQEDYYPIPNGTQCRRVCPCHFNDCLSWLNIKSLHFANDPGPPFHRRHAPPLNSRRTALMYKKWRTTSTRSFPYQRSQRTGNE